MKISRTKYNALKRLLLLYILLSVLYYTQVVDLWEFRKFKYNLGASFNFNFFRYIFSTFIIVFNLWVISTSKISSFIYCVLVIISVLLLIPSSLLFASYEDIIGLIFISHNIFFYAVFLFGFLKYNIPVRKFGNKISYKLLIFITIVGLLPYLRFLPYINIKNLVLKEVYETRAVFKRVGDLYFGYTYSWFNKIIIPAIIVFSIYYKKIKVLIAAVIILIYLYLLGAHKSVLLGVFAILIAYKFTYTELAKYFVKMMIYLTVVCLILFVVFDYSYLTIYTIRRGVFLPALLDVGYFDFFNDQYLYWSNSFLGGVVEYKYDKSHAFIVAERYFDKPDMGANNGIISDGFMNAGMIGVVLNSLVIAIYFSILNNLNISSKFAGLFLLLTILIISSSLSTILLTHGLIILLIIAIFFLKDTQEEFDSQIQDI